MLVLSRKVGEKIVIPGLAAEIAIVAVKGKVVRLGISAPAAVAIRRVEGIGHALPDGQGVPSRFASSLSGS
jgi:carbon storage regulator CsrA